MAQALAVFSQPLRQLAVDPGLLLTDGIALVLAAMGGGNAAQAAPAIAGARRVAAHLVDRVVDSAAIAETRIRHGQAPENDTGDASLPADCYHGMTRVGAMEARLSRR
jgi:hypothetical protein